MRKRSRDGSVLALVDRGKKDVELLEGGSLQPRLTIKPADLSILHAVELSTDGRLLLVRGHEVEKLGGVVQWIADHFGSGYSYESSPGVCQLWDAVTGEKIATMGHRGMISPDGRILATDVRGQRGRLNEFKQPYAFKLWKLPPHRPVEYVCTLCLSVLLGLFVVGRWCIMLVRQVWPGAVQSQNCK